MRHLLYLAALLGAAGCAKGDPETVRPKTGTVSGMMWTETLLGEAKPMRGVRVFLLPEKASKKAIAPLFARLAAREAEVLKQPREWMGRSGPDDVTSLRSFINVAIQSHPDYDSGDLPRRIRSLREDTVVPDTLEAFKVAGVESGIDGRYRIPSVPPGDYFVWCEEFRPGSFAIWALPVHVEVGKEATRDIHDNNVELVVGDSVAATGEPGP